jgi:hypothetical protein
MAFQRFILVDTALIAMMSYPNLKAGAPYSLTRLKPHRGVYGVPGNHYKHFAMMLKTY